MTAFTKINNGAWNSASSWDVGSGFPSTGADTATIGTFDTEIPNGVSITCGAISLTGTNASSRSRLLLNGTLTLAGTLTCNNYNTIQFGPDSVLDMNGNNVEFATSGAGNNEILSTATASNRANVQSTATGGTFRRTGLDVSMRGNLEYVDFTDIGTMSIGDNFNAGDDFTVQYCTWTGCDTVKLGGYRNLANSTTVQYNDFRDTTAATIMCTLASRPQGTGVGTQSFRYNTFNDSAVVSLKSLY